MREQERFWAKVREDGDCWIWTAARNPLGYGRFRVGGRQDGKTVQAHIFAYETMVGPVPEGLELDHVCRTPSCVNPDHLQPVSHAENMRRAMRDTCSKGHPYEPGSYFVKHDNSRVCRKCNADRCRAYWLRKKAAA